MRFQYIEFLINYHSVSGLIAQDVCSMMKSSKNNKTVFVVDDNSQIRESFRCLYESVQLDVETYENGADFLNNYNPQKKGCLITDVCMPLMSGIELVEQLDLSTGKLKVIFITGYGDIPMAVQAMKSGAADFLLKPVNIQHLLDITQKCLREVSKDSPTQPLYEECMKNLTRREKQVMRLVVEGKLNKQIANELNISMSTVEAHRAQVMRKMKVKTLADLIRVNLQAEPA